MRAVGVSRGASVLLPSYIGVSPHEGSGVMDPVRALGANAIFYRLDGELQIDFDDLKAKLQSHLPRLLLLIHYFGRPDPLLAEAAAVGREAGCVVVEDEAHAMLSDLVGGICGRAGHAAFYSLHKLLPLSGGGLLVAGPELSEQALALAAESARLPADFEPWWDYDLLGIAAARQRNTAWIRSAVGKLAGLARPLWPVIAPGVVLQTFPMVLERGDRNRVYEELNGQGLGVVSLYHTLIPEIRAEEFPASWALSRRILNLPVHQDASIEALAELVEHLHTLLAASI